MEFTLRGQYPSRVGVMKARPKMKKQKGLTLLELLVALAIIGILTGSASVFMHDFVATKRLESAAERIYSDLKLAQSEAGVRNDHIYVSFDANGGNWCYGLSKGAQCDCTQANSCQLNGNSSVVDHNEFKGIVMQRARFAGGTSYTAFDPKRGYAQAGTVKNGTVWLKSESDDQLAVIVNRLGRVRFCSPTLSKYSSQCPAVPAL